MDRKTDIENEIEELWRSSFSDAMRVPPSLSEWRNVQNKLLDESMAKSVEYLQPWLGILEFGLDWLGQIHLALNSEGEIGPRQPEYRVPWALIGASCAFGWSIRHACVTGFDTPGRALLRTFVESLFLCIAILYDKSLGDDYEAADTDQKVVTFWHTKASPKNLHGRIIKIENSLGFPKDLVAELTEWRRQEYEVMSQSSHLSYLASILTCLPELIDREEQHGIGIFGRASANSHRTVSYAARMIWYFSRVSYDKIIGPVNSKESLFAVNKEDENHQSIVIGEEVLSAITLKYWKLNA